MLLSVSGSRTRMTLEDVSNSGFGFLFGVSGWMAAASKEKGSSS